MTAAAFFWRAMPRRLELEPLRDTLFPPRRYAEIRSAGGNPSRWLSAAKAAAHGRAGLMPETTPVRTIYLPVLRAGLPSMHELFDFPDPTQIKGQREVTTVSSQSLFFMNNQIVEEAAQNLAEQLLSTKAKDEAKRIEEAWLRIFGRRPSTDESADAQRFLKGLSGSAEYRWSTFLQALFASAEFRYLL